MTRWFLKCFLKCFLNFFFLIRHYLPCSRSAMRKVKHLPRVQPPAKFVHEFSPLVSTTFGVDEDYQGLQEWGGNGLDNKWTILFLGFFPFYRGPPLFSQRWFERPLRKIMFYNSSDLLLVLIYSSIVNISKYLIYVTFWKHSDIF